MGLGAGERIRVYRRGVRALRMQGDHRRLTVWVPPTIDRRLGVAGLLLATLLAGLYIGALLDGSADRTNVGQLAIVVVSVVAFGGVGVVKLALASRRSRRSKVVFDRQTGLVQRTPAPESVRLSDIAAVRVRHHDFAQTSLDLVGRDGLLVCVLCDRLPSRYWSQIEPVVGAINSWLRGEIADPISD